jgi:hypothetical protein
MATRQKPSHPSTHSADRIAKALSSVTPVRVRKLPPPGDRPALEAGDAIVEALDRVMTAKARMVEQRLPPKRPPKPVAAETPERGARAAEGIDEECLSMNDGHIRGRVRYPMTLLPALMHIESDALEARQKRSKPNEPPLRKSKLDKALDFDQTQTLRWALSRYFVDSFLTQESGKSLYEPTISGGNAPRRLMPYGKAQQQALERLAYVRKHLSREDRRDLETFGIMMGDEDLIRQPISMAKFGHSKTGLADERIQEGVAIGVIMKVAERLYDLYRLHTLPSHFLDTSAA